MSSWLIPDHCPPLPQVLAAMFGEGIDSGRVSRETLSFHDSYAATLRQRGLALVRRGSRLFLSRDGQLALGADDLSQPHAGEVAGRVRTLPAGPVTAALAPLLGPWSLHCIGCCRRRTQTWAWRNADDKIVVRVHLESYRRLAPTGADGSILSMVRVVGLRGYDDALLEFEARLEVEGFQPLSTSPAEIVLTALCGSVSTPVVGFAPAVFSGESCRDAVFNIAGSLLAAMRGFELGIIEDVDCECLHAYRVLLRKLRSLLSQFSQVLLDADEEPLCTALATLARRTNRLRDVDVFLMSEAQYRELVPEPLRDGLHVVFAEARRERGLERGRVVRYMTSKSYQQTMAGLEETFRSPLKYAPTRASARSVGKEARKRIAKRYARVLAGAEMAAAHVEDDAALHALRIQCKKLRYLLELFGSVCEPKAGALLGRRCRDLQNCLGAFNDLAVQQRHLIDLARRRNADPQLDSPSAVAVGALIGVLSSRQQHLRGSIPRELRRIGAAGPRRAARALKPGNEGRRT